MSRMIPALRECALVVVDVQRLFLEPTPWQVSDLPAIMGPLSRLLRVAGQRSVFTRFRTPPTASEAPGTWETFYRRWDAVLADRMPVHMFDVVPEMMEIAPGASVCDKTTYSAFEGPGFQEALERLGAQHLVFTGVETDVCVLATLLGAIDRGYGTWLVRDAVASASPEASKAVIETLMPRLPEQVRITESATLAAAWSEI